MNEPLKIKISIADRVYPLTVNPSQEEGMRSASKKIETMIKQFEEKLLLLLLALLSIKRPNGILTLQIRVTI